LNDALPLPYPHARATILDDKITIVDWDPRFKRTSLLAGVRSNAEYADLQFLGEPEPREVLVAHDVSDALSGRSQELLVAWAASVGLDRIWLLGELVDLSETREPAGRVSVTCPVCSAELSGHSLAFWAGVRSSGMFPTRCSSCGGNLPQWETSVAAAVKDLS
jgi:hypothetical protein